ncbi:unannotated protein [freshwater metagenome]|uniref:Unannotated protein n=1 Tax=freshwater metagenome TaxID=449393 RepID=A0A6J7ETE3_9ZZZZ
MLRRALRVAWVVVGKEVTGGAGRGRPPGADRAASGALKPFKNSRDRNVESLPKGYDIGVICERFRAQTFLARKLPDMAVSAWFYTNIEAGDL